MRYITIKRFIGDTLSGRINIDYGKTLIRRGDGILYYNNLPICKAESSVAYRHFALNDDDKGLLRGALSWFILDSLKPKKLGSSFFNAPVEVLKHFVSILKICSKRKSKGRGLSYGRNGNHEVG